MAKKFGFSEIQANHILDMQLVRLTRLGKAELDEEMAKLRETIKTLEEILGNDKVLRSVIKNELADVREKFADERRSKITLDAGEMNIEDLIDDEELVVTLSAKGYIKTVLADAFRSQGRGGRGVAGAKLRDEDYVSHILTTTAHAYLLFFSNLGRVYRLKAHEIPKKERTARGTAMPNLLQLQPGEHIQTIIDTRDYETNRFLFFATKKGQVKKTKFNEYDSSLRTGIIAINLRGGDELVKVIPTNGGDDILMLSKLGQAIRFSEDDVRPMGRAAAGVRGMKLRAEDEVVSLDTCRDDTAMLDRHRRRLRQAHPARALQPPGPRRPGRARHQAHRQEGPRGGGLHGRPRRRDLRDQQRRHAHPHARARHLLAGPRRHRRAGHVPRRGRDRGLGGPGPLGRRRHRLAPTSSPPLPPLRAPGAPAPRSGEDECEMHATVRDERGQAVPIVLGLMAVAVVVAAGPAAARRRRPSSAPAARNAADAAALAGAAEGEAAAREVAAANGAELVRWRARGLDVWVVVTLGDARAEAKARRER